MYRTKFVLAIGPLPPPYGGTTILFSDFCRDISRLSEFELVSINSSSKASGGLGLRFYDSFRHLLRLFRYGLRADVVCLHASNRRFCWYGGALRIFSVMFNKPVILRAFGGSLDLWLNQASAFERWLFSLAIRNDLVLVETKYLVNVFQSKFPESNIEWHPNCRPFHAPVAKEVRPRCFVFVGTVCEDKGVGLLIDMLLANSKKDIEIHLIGPLVGSDSFRNRILSSAGLTYLGPLAPSTVRDMLGEYEGLLLPTRYAGEGYPGVILEAYLAGIPVFASRWRAIPEIVLEGRTGFLFNPIDHHELLRILESYLTDPELRVRMGAHGREFASQFDSLHWHGVLWPSWFNLAIGQH